MRLFIDANVFISGIVFKGNEFKLLYSSMLSKEDEFITSEHVIDEITRVMVRKFPDHINLTKEVFDILKLRVVPKQEYMAQIDGITEVRDKHDRHVLAADIATKCDIIVTGDKDLLTLHTYRQIEISKPRQALETIK
ncbi:MAG: putative toxin-antitoxin system toxin component, PIN family [Thermoplasmata archaeon]|nr:putative toxin-antitoxin system toxin component, PIN family [Thermoplasmata archaeon]